MRNACAVRNRKQHVTWRKNISKNCAVRSIKRKVLKRFLKKHITDKNSKYFLFCSDYEHLCEMTEKVSEWFGEIDENPHIYKVYSEAPSTDEAFAAFK